LKEKRAAYGEEIVQALAAQLAVEFGSSGKFRHFADGRKKGAGTNGREERLPPDGSSPPAPNHNPP
jgi:hypothetical protein